VSVEEIDVIVSFLDVGHGDAAVIRFREGSELRTIVVDGGGPRHADAVLSYLLRNTITRVDLMVATHIDRNHLAGLLPVVESERLTIQNFWGPACESNQPSVKGLRSADERAYQRLYARVSQRVRPEHILCPHRGMPLPTLFRDCAITVLSPMRQNVLRPPAEDEEPRKPIDLAAEQNEHAMVLHIECHGLRILLASDLDGPPLSSLLGDPTLQDFFDIDILKVPHYGRSHHAVPALRQALRDHCAAVVSIARGDDKAVSRDLLGTLRDLRAEVFCTEHTDAEAYCANPHCRAAKGGQNIVFFYRHGAPSFTPSADACALTLG